jgi:hypothetical protein
MSVLGFNLPLSDHLDFEVNTKGQAFFRAYDGRVGKLPLKTDASTLPLTIEEFAALFQLLDLNREKIAQELQELEGGKTRG